jgi:hypothetical protein
MRSLVTALLIVALPLLGGCRSVRPLPPDSSPGAERRYDDSVPGWVGQPLSWDKLAEVEAWLDGPALEASDFWRLEGVLELAQGRLEFALRDRDKLGEGRVASRVPGSLEHPATSPTSPPSLPPDEVAPPSVH